MVCFGVAPQLIQRHGQGRVAFVHIDIVLLYLVSEPVFKEVPDAYERRYVTG